MKKLLISFSDPQDAWLREEAERTGLPGGVSELVRRAVDAYREAEAEVRATTIPAEVLEKIVKHRPHLKTTVDNLTAHPNQTAQIEKAIAVAYLAGETKLTPLETYHLAACASGRPYGT